MRFLLAFVLSFISVFALGQSAPPMKVGGPQGVDVTRLLSRDWLSVPIYIDTPAAPLTGAGWPGAAYIIQATKSYREATIEEWLDWTESAGGLTQLDSIRWQDGQGTIYFLPKGIDTSQVLDYLLYGDTSVWHYTGKKWRRVGGNAEFYFDYLLDGGFVTQVAPASSRQFTISPADYYLGGVRYKYDTTFRIQAPSKAADSTGRIDVIFLSTTGPRLAKGNPSRTPVKPQVRSGSIELASIYFRPFDTIPNVVNGKSVSSIYRIIGRDSIYYTIDTLTFAIKDSIGISKNDTVGMLNPYKFTAANGLTKDSTVFRLGGSLNQNTDINLNTRRLTFIGGNDTTRFYAGGQVSIAGVPDSNTVHHLINKKNSRLGNLEISSNRSSSITGTGIRIDGTDQPFKLQSSSKPLDGNFSFATWGVNDTVPVTMGVSLGSASRNNNINIRLGFLREAGGASADTISGNVLNIIPKYNIFYDSGRSIVRGIYYNPTIQALNKTTHIAYQNTTGSNWLNSTSGNTKIGYNRVITNDALDTAYKLDINGNMRVVSGRIVYGTDTTDVPLIIRKGWGGATSPGVNIGWNTVMTNQTGSYLLSDRTQITGNSLFINAIGNQNDIDSCINCTVIGTANNLPNSTSHQIVLGYSNTSNSYSNSQNASIVVGLGNNTNGYWGSGLIGSYLKYYENGQLAFGGNSSNVNFATRNVYFGNGVKNENNNSNANFGHGPDVAINPSWANDADSSLTDSPRVSNANRRGGSLTLAGGRGTGTGTAGSVIFSTWKDTISGSILHPRLLERARISERGNLLVGTSTDDTSSLVNIVSTTKGFLQPRMNNTERNAITTPATGLQLFSTTDSANYVYRGTGGGWQKIANEITKDTTIDFPSTGHGTNYDVSFTVTGAELGDVVSIGIPHAAMSPNISYTAWVSAANQVTIRLDHYASSGNVDPASGTFKVKVFK